MNEITPLNKDIAPFNISPKATTAEIRDLINEIENQAVTHGAPIEIPGEHYFSKGVYGREMKMPAGALVVGHIHKHAQLNILSEGEAWVLSQDHGLKKVKAPYTFVGTPGAKRVILALTPLTWTTIHGTDDIDLDKIENEFIAKNYDEVVLLDTPEERKCLG